MNLAWLLSFKDMKLKRSISHDHSAFVFVLTKTKVMLLNNCFLFFSSGYLLFKYIR